MDNQRSADSRRRRGREFRTANMCATRRSPTRRSRCATALTAAGGRSGLHHLRQLHGADHLVLAQRPQLQRHEHGVPCFAMKAMYDFFASLPVARRPRPRKNARHAMRTRRRIDWPEIIEPRRAANPIWKRVPARSDVVGPGAQARAPVSRPPSRRSRKRTVELALGAEAGARGDLLLRRSPGPHGRQLGDRPPPQGRRRAFAMFRLDSGGSSAFARAMSGEALWTVVEDCPIIVNDENRTRVVGRGLGGLHADLLGEPAAGALYNDAGLTRARVDPDKQAKAALLCAVVRDAARRDAALARPQLRRGVVVAPPRGDQGDPHPGGGSVAVRVLSRRTPPGQPGPLRARVQERDGRVAGAVPQSAAPGTVREDHGRRAQEHAARRRAPPASAATPSFTASSSRCAARRRAPIWGVAAGGRERS